MKHLLDLRMTWRSFETFSYYVTRVNSRNVLLGTIKCITINSQSLLAIQYRFRRVKERRQHTFFPELQDGRWHPIVTAVCPRFGTTAVSIFRMNIVTADLVRIFTTNHTTVESSSLR